MNQEKEDDVDDARIDSILGLDDPAAPDDEVVCVVGQTGLKRRVIKCLLPKEWVNCETIDAFLHVLQQRADQSGVKMMFLATHFYTMITKPEYNFNGGLQYFHNVNPFDCREIVIPINQGEQHWVTIVVDMKAKRFDLYDPLYQVDTKHVELNTVKTWFLDLVRLRNLRSLNIPLWEAKLSMDCPKQTDDFNCGLYVMLLAEFLGRPERVGHLVIDQNNSTQLRRSIVQALCRKQIV